jgi:hypothetical protein
MDAAAARSGSSSTKRQDLFVRLARLTASLGRAANDVSAVLRLEWDQARPLVEEIRSFVQRDHLTLARPIWTPMPMVRDASFVYFSGPEPRRVQLDRLARERRAMVSAGLYPGSDTADARWRDLRAAGLAVFDLSENDPQIYYDIGITVTLGTQLLLLTTEGVDLPFNIAQDVITYPSSGLSDESLERLLDEALHAVSAMSSPGSSVAATVDYARRLADNDDRPLARVILDELEADEDDPLAVFAALKTLPVALEDDRLTVLRSRWPSSYPEEGHRRCFVVMPFREDLYPTFDLIAERCHAASVDPVRGDRAEGEEIIARIWKELGRADRIVVDLTGLNPNVCLELGIADSLGRSTYLLGLRGTEKDLFPAIATRDCHPYDKPGDPTAELVASLDAFLA